MAIMLTRRCIILIIILTFLGCSEKPINRSTVIGKYVANHKLGTDTLELREDGIYTYYFKFPDGRELKNSNRWELEYKKKKTMITFDDFVFALPNYESRTKKPAFWIVEVERLWKKSRLCIDPDLYYYYEKRD